MFTAEVPDYIYEGVEQFRWKLRWIPHYVSLPFVFGLAFAEDSLEVHAICENDAKSRCLLKVNLTDTEGRWKCVVAMINIARTIKLFAEQSLVCPSKLRFVAPSVFAQTRNGLK